jgi:hypothetical protein
MPLMPQLIETWPQDLEDLDQDKAPHKQAEQVKVPRLKGFNT